MSERWKKRFKWFGAGFAGSFFFFLYAVWIPYKIPNDEFVGYMGNVASGVLGGGVTLFAGWLAWSAAQRQIEKQQEILEQVSNEHRQRKIRLLLAFDHFLEQLLRQIVYFEYRRRGVSYGPVWRRFSDMSYLLTDPDLWRLDYDLVLRLQGIEAQIFALNEILPSEKLGKMQAMNIIEADTRATDLKFYLPAARSAVIGHLEHLGISM